MNYNGTIKKLQFAINKDGKFTVLYNTSQFYSPQQKRPVTMYSIKLLKAGSEKNTYTEIFRTARQLYIVFFLRNIWYICQNKEIEETQFEDFENGWKACLERYNLTEKGDL